ncbi:hypothetical protein [Pseudomonas viridiflava]|uniref:hypothetical protein n=1 Tax=Pseudomonas syringae group TaxID=136849 RepID=UPI0013D06CC4|nr:hypothetical protein [Pseudomonas viridiflava]
MSSRQLEEAQEYRRNEILGKHIGLTADEVAEYVTDIQEQDDSTGLVIYFSIAIPQTVRDKVDGLGGDLYIYTGPIDFDEDDDEGDH